MTDKNSYEPIKIFTPSEYKWSFSGGSSEPVIEIVCQSLIPELMTLVIESLGMQAANEIVRLRAEVASLKGKAND